MINAKWKMTPVTVGSIKLPRTTRVNLSAENQLVHQNRSSESEKTMRRVKFVGVCLAPLIWFAVAGVVTAQSEISSLPAKQAEQLIAGRAHQVMLALKSRNLARLSSLVHPRKGLRFSPYHSVNLDRGGDLVFKRDQVKGLFNSRKRYHWGDDDGSGDPIRLTYAAYHRKFVFDHDYLRAKQITYNSENLTSGNLINNIRQSYPGSIIVEYHFPGFQEKYGGMDWKSVWLIFEKDGTEWYLVGIAHGEWTV
jgi:hypothetical protein